MPRLSTERATRAPRDHLWITRAALFAAAVAGLLFWDARYHQGTIWTQVAEQVRQYEQVGLDLWRRLADPRRWSAAHPAG